MKRNKMKRKYLMYEQPLYISDINDLYDMYDVTNDNMCEISKNNFCDIKFMKHSMPIELEYEYDILILSQTCTFEESLKIENRLPERYDYQTSSLITKSSILKLLQKKQLRNSRIDDYNIFNRIENENYRIVINLFGNEYSNKLVYGDLANGIVNLLFWEYECNKKHALLRYDSTYEIDQVDIIFENELTEYNEKMSALIKPESKDLLKNNIEHRLTGSKCDLEIKYYDSSTLLLHIDDETFCDLEARPCYIKATVFFGSSDEKQIYENYSFGRLEVMKFEIDCIERCKELTSDQNSSFYGKNFRFDEVLFSFDRFKHDYSRHVEHEIGL